MSAMSTYTQIYYHIVFETKNRASCLKRESRDNLFKYIWGVLRNKDYHLYRINGVGDHWHIFTHIHPSIAPADLIRDIKLSTTEWIKKEKVFPLFPAWQEGYAAFTASHKDKDRIIDYIKKQEEHYKKKSFREEMEELLQEAGIEYDERYLV